MLAIEQVDSGGPLNDLSTMSTNLFLGDLVSPLMQQLPKVLGFGMHVAALAANSTLLNLVAKFILLAVYAELTTQGPNPTKLVIPASDVVATHMPQETESKECPGQLPSCSNCGGNKAPPKDPPNSRGICAGLPELDGYPADCACVDPFDQGKNAPFASEQAFMDAQNLLDSIVANKIKPPCRKGAMFTEHEDCQANCSGTCRLIQPKPPAGCKACSEGAEPEHQCIC